MPRRLLKIVSNSLSREASRNSSTFAFALEDVVWSMGSFCALNRKPFDAELLSKQFPLPYTSDSFIHAARALGFKIKRRDCDSRAVAAFNLPCLVVLHEPVTLGRPEVAPDMAVAQVELAVMPTETSANLEENAGALATGKVSMNNKQHKQSLFAWERLTEGFVQTCGLHKSVYSQ